VATVNGEPIYFEDLEGLLVDLHSTAGEGGSSRPFDLDRLMTQVINDTLLAQEARFLGLHEDEVTSRKMDALAMRLAIDKLEREVVRRALEPTAEELEEAFHRDFKEVTLRTLTVAEKDEAERLREELRSGADMLEMIEEHSIDRRLTFPLRVSGRGWLEGSAASSVVLRSTARVEFGLDVPSVDDLRVEVLTSALQKEGERRSPTDFARNRERASVKLG
jgi:hypothetical protein